MRSWQILLHELKLLAYQALAARIMRHKKLESAHDLIDVYARNSKPLCLKPGCKSEISKRLVSCHCDSHLENHKNITWELDENEETCKADAHPLVQAVMQLRKEHRLKVIEATRLLLENFVDDARRLVDEQACAKREQKAFLPTWLFKRLNSAENIRSSDL